MGGWAYSPCIYLSAVNYNEAEVNYKTQVVEQFLQLLKLHFKYFSIIWKNADKWAEIRLFPHVLMMYFQH